MQTDSPIEFDGSLEEFETLSDASFAQEWRLRYMQLRAQMVPDIARWLRLLHFFHPRRLEDHWQDQFGNPLPKLYKSEGLSVEIYNWCRPIIEVYGSLLAGQKPMPFNIDVPPIDPEDAVERYRADAQEKIIRNEMYRQKIPLHFVDFCTSVVLFGIGYVCSWIDTDSGKLRTQALPWPGDVLPQWGSDRYGSGADALESCIITERISLDSAKRLYPDANFIASSNVFGNLNWDGTPTLFGPNVDSTLLLKIWWRWTDQTASKKKRDKVGYAVVAFDGVPEEANSVLYREDDSGYPDIPIRWSTRFATPMNAPHRGAGVLDDVVGINTEYNEKLSALADMIMKLVYIKYKAKGFAPGHAPRLSMDSNMYTLSQNQDIQAIQEQINQMPFDGFLSRLETMMFTVSGLSRLMMGSMHQGETSGEALANLLHAAIGRLEGVRTPIMWAWMGLFDDIWVPLIKDNYKVKGVDAAGRLKDLSLSEIFQNYNRSQIIWPDVTPRDALRSAELAMNLHKAGGISREGMMERAQIPSVVDEIEKMRKENVDPILSPEMVQKTAMATEAYIAAQRAQRLSTMDVLPPAMPQTRVMLRGDLSPSEVQSAAMNAHIQGAPPALSPAGTSMEPPWMSTQANAQGQSVTPPNPGAPSPFYANPAIAQQQMNMPQQPYAPQDVNQNAASQGVMKNAAMMQDISRKLEASRTPTLNEANNLPVPGSEESARQGYNNTKKHK